MKKNGRLCVLSILALGVGAAQAEMPRQDTIVVHGEVASSSPVESGLSVELAGNGIPAQKALVNADNSFEIRAAAQGVYQLRVIAQNGQVIHEEYVSINPNQTLSIRLPERTASNNSHESSISLQQLRHKVPPDAQKAYQKGERLAAKGDLGQARVCFQEAVSRDPEFADAYNELGAAMAGLNDLPKAAEQFQKAIDLAPEHRRALPNLSIVLAKMDRYHEAGVVARRALRVVPEDGHIHYILAASLMLEHGNIDEIVTHLERAAGDIPAAHVTAAELLSQNGRSQEAINQFKAYLLAAAPSDPLRPKVEERLAQLLQ